MPRFDSSGNSHISIKPYKDLIFKYFRFWCTVSDIFSFFTEYNAKEVISCIIQKSNRIHETPSLRCAKVSQSCLALAVLNLGNKGGDNLTIQHDWLV